jgi:hypothetical protein
VPDRFCEHDHEPSRQPAVGTPQDTDAGTLPPLQVGPDDVPCTVKIASPDAPPVPHAFVARMRVKYTPAGKPLIWVLVATTARVVTLLAPAAVPTST